MTKVLVVDDEEDIQLLIKQRFSQQIRTGELQFVYALNGNQALQVLRQNTDIHVILTDINMPEMDGLTLLSQLPDFKRLFKTVIISAYGDMSNIRKAMNRGACDFVTKPIDFKDLEITIFNAIEQSITLNKAIQAQETLTDIEKELEIAHKIQQSSLPHQFQPFADQQTFEIAATMIPARQVGGDFFDFFQIDEHHLGFVIADVSGKGIPAALFMSMSRAIIRTLGQMKYSAKNCMTSANQSLCVDNESCMFVTTFYGILNLQTREIQCCNAGHNPPYLRRADGTLHQVGIEHGIPLGIMEKADYKQETILLNPGDTLILYTDGVTEAMDISRQLYGEGRLEHLIDKWTDGNLSTLISMLLKDIQEFTKDTPQSDDITLLCLKQLK